MNFRHTVFTAAALAALLQAPIASMAQTATPAAPVAAASHAATLPPAAKAPTGWIRYEDRTYTPVVDDVSRHLAAARTALASHDNAKAADSMQAAARALQEQADRATALDRQHAVADVRVARQSHARMVMLTKRLDAVAAQIRAGKVPTTATLDKVLGKAQRSDLERRWLVTDVTTWYSVADEPQRHFGAAIEAYAKKDYQAAASEVRKAAGYVRLESARAVGSTGKELDAAAAALEKTARSLDKGAVRTGKDLDKVFAKADHALALAHRAEAAQSWARKAYDKTGYELKAAAQGIEGAAVWSGAEAKAAAAAGAADARAIGNKLASGGVWAKDEVAKGFESLGTALNSMGRSIGSRGKAAPFDVGT